MKLVLAWLALLTMVYLNGLERGWDLDGRYFILAAVVVVFLGARKPFLSYMNKRGENDDNKYK